MSGDPNEFVTKEFATGSVLAGYRIEEAIGQGGMAIVFRAHDSRLERDVALKILAPRLAGNQAFRHRFIRESRAAAGVDNPHIIPVYEAGEANGVLFIAMRLVRGGDLKSLLDRTGPLPLARAVDIILQAASALDCAHAQGLVHRDVKAANILLDSGRSGEEPDHVYVSDFGVTKEALAATGLTAADQLVGTLDYLAPEQIQGRQIDGRTDQYALACTTFELLTGSPPFRRETPTAVMYAHVSETPPFVSAGLPEALDEVLQRALSKEPAGRYDSCTQFAAALRRVRDMTPARIRASELPREEVQAPAFGDLATLDFDRAVAPAAVSPHGERPLPPASADVRTPTVVVPKNLAAREEHVTNNLPVQLSSFFGRREELETGARLLGSARLLSIVGPGGTGKTRVSYELAAAQLKQFPDGVWVAELSSVSDGDLVPAALMSAIGLREEPGCSVTDRVVSFLSSRRALVVLDNCEHLLEASATVVRELLQRCPALRLLTTSREPLHVRGEMVWTLAPLALPADDDLSLEALAQSDAVALFCARAAEAKVGFNLSEDNASTIKSICERLEGFPLAIELTAARVRTFALSELASRLERDLDLLSTGGRDSQSRQGSLRAAITWSHDLLAEAERTLFRRLAIFSGGFTLEAIDGVCTTDTGSGFDVVETLSSLVDKSLVVLGEEQGGVGRYRLLGVMRSYAAERLQAAGEEAALADRHAEFFAELAHACIEKGDSVASVALLEADHPNLLAALEHLAHDMSAHRHGQLVADLSSFWDLRNHRHIARREYQRYLDRPDGEPALRQRCLAGLGRVAFALWDIAEAGDLFQQALEIAREIHDREQQAICLRDLGGVVKRTGDCASAQHYYEEALALAREIGDRKLEGRCLGSLGITSAELGDNASGRRNYEAALEIARETADLAFEGVWLGNLGVLASNTGAYQEARLHFTEALEIAREIGHRSRETHLLGDLGIVAARLGEVEQARSLLEEGIRLAHRDGESGAAAYWLIDLGDLALADGDVGTARAHYESARGVAVKIGDRRLESYSIGSLGVLGTRVNDVPAARAQLEEALAIAREMADVRYQGECARGLGDAAFCEGAHRQAATCYTEALRIARNLGEEDSPLLEGCARLLAELGRCEDAITLLGAADTSNASRQRLRTGWEQARYDTTLLACRDRLDERTLESASKSGRSLDRQGALDVALAAVASL